ncbi:hypothetical protein D3C75_1286070 [compost metagenome]
MRIALAILLEIMTIVTGGRHAKAIQRQHLLGNLTIFAGQLQGHFPVTAIRFSPQRLELPRGLDQQIRDPQGV